MDTVRDSGPIASHRKSGRNKAKVKFTVKQATKAQKGVDIYTYFYSFSNLGA